MRAKTLTWLSFGLLVATLLSAAFVDRPLALLISEQLEGATQVAGAITTALEWIFAFEISKYLYAFAFLPLGVVFHIWKRRLTPARNWYFLGITLLLSRVISGTLKNVFERLRPRQFLESRQPADFFVDGGSAFPSGHAAFYLGLSLPLAFLFPRFVWTFIAFGVVASLARVFELDHYLSDILASGFVALLLAFAFAKAFRIQPVGLTTPRR